jgi:hypothetical protein
VGRPFRTALQIEAGAAIPYVIADNPIKGKRTLNVVPRNRGKINRYAIPGIPHLPIFESYEIIRQAIRITKDKHYEAYT